MNERQYQTTSKRTHEGAMMAAKESTQETEARIFAVNLMQHLVIPTFVLDHECMSNDLESHLRKINRYTFI